MSVQLGARAQRPGPGPETKKSESLSPLAEGVLLTVLYSDLFDYPLLEEEVHRYLVGDREVELSELETALTALCGRYLERRDGFVFWRGRGELIERRRRRQQLSVDRWVQAERFGRLLRWVPFLRMTAVCGSLAVENGEAASDVDLFLVAEPDRLWLVQLAASILRRVASSSGVSVCPNYLLARHRLEVEPHSLYTAREVAQATPLWGEAVYDEFLAANRWVLRYLPNLGPELRLEERRRRLDDAAKPKLARVAERWLAGRLGGLLDRWVHRALLLYYPLRLWRRGWSRRSFRDSYRRDAQVVMTGGYGPAVARAFREHARHRLGVIDSATLDRLFPAAAGAPSRPDALYARLFADRYQEEPSRAPGG